MKHIQETDFENIVQNKEFLLKLYEECMHEMIDFKNSAAKYFINFSTVIIVTLGWVESNYTNVTFKNKLIFSAGLILLTFFFMILNRTYTNHVYGTSLVVKRIDTLFKSYEKGYYVKDQTLLPIEWKTISKKNFKEPIFEIAKWGFIALVIFGLIVIWTL